MRLRDEFVQIMNNQGAIYENGWHSWRCFDKVRYPEPCRCTETVAEMLVAAALRDAVEAVKAIEGPLHSVRTSNDAQRGWDAHKRHVVAAIDALGGVRVINQANLHEISVNTDGSGTGAIQSLGGER